MTASVSTEIRNAIAIANDRFMATFSRGDAAGLAALYTENAEVLPPNSNLVKGKPAIQTLWRSVMNQGIKGVKMEIVEVESHGDTAIEESKYTLQGEGDKLLDEGKVIVVWKQEEGQWKLHRDIFNSNLPAQPSASPLDRQD